MILVILELGFIFKNSTDRLCVHKFSLTFFIQFCLEEKYSCKIGQKDNSFNSNTSSDVGPEVT